MKIHTGSLEALTGRLHTIETREFQCEAFRVEGVPPWALEVTRAAIRSALRSAGKTESSQRLLSLCPAVNQYADRDGISLALTVAAVDEDLPDPGGLFLGLVDPNSGRILYSRGSVSIVEAAREAGIRRVFCSPFHLEELGGIKGIELHACTDLDELLWRLKLGTLRPAEPEPPAPEVDTLPDLQIPMLSKAVQRAWARRAPLLVEAPPGSLLPTLGAQVAQALDPLSSQESAEVRRILSAAGRSPQRGRPCRVLHESASVDSLQGTRDPLRAGELTHAHRGVLLLRDAPLFAPASLEAVRKAFVTQEVPDPRGAGYASLPSDFFLILTRTPCICGWRRSGMDRCTCEGTPQDKHYQERLDGFLALDPVVVWLPHGTGLTVDDP